MELPPEIRNPSLVSYSTIAEAVRGITIQLQLNFFGFSVRRNKTSAIQLSRGMVTFSL